MTDIVVAAISGPYAVTSEKGEALVVTIGARLDEPGKLNLDFTGVRVFASAFFTTLVGRLLQLHTRELLNERLEFVGLTADGSQLLRAVITNAKQFYAEPGP